MLWAMLTLPLLTGLLCLAAPDPRLTERLHLAGTLGTLAAGLAVAAQVFSGGPLLALGDLLYVDALSALLIVVIVTVGALAGVYSVGYLRRDVEHGETAADQLRWYYLGYHAFLWTMLATVVMNNLGLLWVAVEATTLASALLVGFYRTRAALEAAWKYLILCSVGITFALFGVLLIYYTASHGPGEGIGLNWTALTAQAAALDPNLTKLAFIFVLVGFGAKAGLAPLHAWLPDAHSQAPSPVSAVLSGVLLNCALYGILRFHMITVAVVGPDFSSNLLLGFGMLSVAVAVPFMLTARDVKRLLAYSSVEHIGLIAAAVGLGGPLALYAGMLHLLNHALTKALLFFVAGELVQRYGVRRINAIRGVLAAAPYTGPLLLLGAFAITGMPPFGIFVTELGILGAGFTMGHGWLAGALAALLTLAFAAMAYHFGRMAFGPSNLRPGHFRLDRAGAAAMAVPAAGVTLLGVYVPPALSEALVQSVTLLLGGGR